MFNNLLGNSVFGEKIAPDLCKLTYDGKIAVRVEKAQDGKPAVYKSYDLKKNRLTNQDKFLLSMPDNTFMIWPTTKVKKGDIILVKGKPRCVIKSNSDEFTVVNYETGAIETILPERYALMGDTYFYGKIVSMYQMMGSNGIGSMIKLSLLSSMFGDGNSNSAMSGNSGNMFQNMMMMKMMGGLFKDDSGLDNIFDNMFDDDFIESFNLFEDDADKEED